MTTHKQVLTGTQLETLRQKGLIESNEVAYISGDLLIAENVISNDRRVVGESTIISESSNRRVLKG